MSDLRTAVMEYGGAQNEFGLAGGRFEDEEHERELMDDWNHCNDLIERAERIEGLLRQIVEEATPLPTPLLDQMAAVPNGIIEAACRELGSS